MRAANVDIDANGKWRSATVNALLHVCTEALRTTVYGDTVTHRLLAFLRTLGSFHDAARLPLPG